MFTAISLTGRVTADLEPQTSQNGTPYVQFYVAVNKGFGEHQHPNFYQCVLFGKAVERAVNAGVQKGSLLFITGDLDLVDYTRKSDGHKGTIPKITVYEWNYIPTGKKTDDAGTGNPESSASENGFVPISAEDCGEDGLPYN